MEKQSKLRREYNAYVSDETIEDYSLRYTPKSFRTFSELLIANTAMGSISFLALEAIGASIAINYGFMTAFWAILTAAIIIFLTAIPISYHAAKYNIDIDLITRSAGFGYVGSTITSLIYASFSFIFFALEAAIMAQAIELYFGLPLSWGYLLSSLVIIPLTFYGITFINKLQLYTQPIWITLMVLPFIAVLVKEPEAIKNFMSMSGVISGSSEFNLYYFGFAMGISLSLIAQIGEQVDYLRFMPPLKKKNRYKWWSSVIIAGPGWIVLGFLKQIGGMFLASIVLMGGLSIAQSKEPIQMYNIGYTYLFNNPDIALAIATFFVIMSQIKINVTNAYAGSLAWSNFFSRITHSHPGRVVWMFFNISIALLLMEFGVFDALASILGLYSNVAIAWIGAIAADLVINKPLGLSPKIIEFKRAYLHNINPVGMGSMGFASFFSILAFMGVFGDMAQSYSSVIALLLSLILAPLIAWLTDGKYYIARKNELILQPQETYSCSMCDTEYEKEDMAFCPLHNINICSLCCSLDSLCHDVCKKETKSTLLKKTTLFIRELFLNKISQTTAQRLFTFVGLTSLILFLITVSAWMIYDAKMQTLPLVFASTLEDSFKILIATIGILVSILVWWVLLLQENRKMAETELEEKNMILQDSKEALDYQAHHDVLTKLPNRLLFNDRVHKAIQQATRDKSQIALFFIDLDRFKQINDSLGHQVGDKVLIETANRLKESIREVDSLARLGGDEFTVLMEGLRCSEDASVLAKKIIDAIIEPMLFNGQTLYLSASIGISLFPNDSREIDKLFMYADSAMYKAKEEGRNNFQFYASEMTALASKRLEIEAKLYKAIDNEEFLVYYQPQIDARERKIIGMEALIRWNHPKDGLIPPFEFIGIAEDNGLIVPIDLWVMDRAMRQLVEWYKEGLNPGVLALNLSLKQLHQENFIETFAKILKRTACKPEWVELEVTESSIMQNPEDSIALLDKLSAMGIELAIDDFGTGYSSLSYLKRLPLDKLKIDKSFIDDIPHKEEDVGISKAIIALAKSLNLRVIAEGVETQEQLDFLLENDCDNIQGYFFSKPLPSDAMQKYLQNPKLND